MSDLMMKDEVVVKLRKLLKDEDLLDRDERNLVAQAADLLGTSMFTLLMMAFKAGYLDGMRKMCGSNPHIHAEQMGQSYAQKILNRGIPN